MTSYALDDRILVSPRHMAGAGDRFADVFGPLITSSAGPGSATPPPGTSGSTASAAAWSATSPPRALCVTSSIFAPRSCR